MKSNESTHELFIAVGSFSKSFDFSRRHLCLHCVFCMHSPPGEKFNKKTCRVDRVANHVTLGRQLNALVTWHTWRLAELCWDSAALLPRVPAFALRFCCAVLCPKTMKKKAKKGRKAKVKGRKRRDPVLQYGWRTDFFLNLCSTSFMTQYWKTWKTCVQGLLSWALDLEDVLLAVDNNLSGIEPGLAAVEFQGAGISHHSPLVKEHQSHMLSVWWAVMIGCYDERHSERLWKTL